MTGKGGTARKPAPGSGNAAGDAKSPPLDKKKEKAEPPAPD